MNDVLCYRLQIIYKKIERYSGIFFLADHQGKKEWVSESITSISSFKSFFTNFGFVFLQVHIAPVINIVNNATVYTIINDIRTIVDLQKTVTPFHRC